MTTRDALKMAAVAIDGLELIQRLTKVGGDKAGAALATIDSLVASLQAGLDGKLSPQAVLARIDLLRDSIRANDAAADAAAAAKFGGTP